jgi:hypothetical protein
MAIKKGHKKRGPIFIEKHPSQNNDNYGHVNAKWIKHFKDEITREIFTLTDLQEKKHMRLLKLEAFIEHYGHLCFKEKTVTILTCVVSQFHFPKLKKFFENFKKKVIRHKSKVLDNYWQRDIGESSLNNHYHVLIATERMSKLQLEHLGVTKYNPNEINTLPIHGSQYTYKLQYMVKEFGMFDYLKDKAIIIHNENERSYGGSRKTKKK